MTRQKLGLGGPEVSVLAYGCMRIPGGWDPAKVIDENRAAGKAAVHAAWDAGYTLFDHADIYCSGVAESIFGEALKESADLRAGAIIATKCGIRWAGDPDPAAPHRYDFSKEHILRSCEASLTRLGVETIDLYQLHRPDFLMDPREVAEAFGELHRSGKVRHFGVSNFSASQFDLLQSGLPLPLQVNQIELSLAHLDPLSDGVLDQCLRHQVTPLAWSPMAGGWLGDLENAPEDRRELALALREVAETHGTSPMVIALAWVMRHPSRPIPIVGSVRPDRIRESARASEIALSREEWYRLLIAARGVGLP